MVSVDSFPKDDIERVIYLFGGVQRNTSDSTNPLIEVCSGLIQQDTFLREY